MLQAVDKQGKTYASYQIETKEEIERIRSMTKKELLVCPECGHPLIFRAGEKKVMHFAHQVNSECVYPYWEPETREHTEGKLLLKRWAEMMHPYSEVKLEYKFPGTQQRSDVVMIHPNGTKVAIEFQCVSLSQEVWEERHTLYQKAGVRDVWIFGDALYSGGVNKSIHRVRGGMREVYQIQKALYYLNPLKEQMRMMYQYEGKPSKKPTEIHAPLHAEHVMKTFWFGEYIVSKGMGSKLKVHIEKEEEKQRKEVMWLADKKKRILELREESQSLPQRMTEKEIELFQTLCKKHKITPQSLPGCFQIRVSQEKKIETPPQLWQFWIYDEFFSEKPAHLSDVPFFTIKQTFEQMVTKGVFRVKNTNKKEGYLEDLRKYLDVLKGIRLLEKWAEDGKERYSIIADGVPVYEEKGTNFLVCLALEDKQTCDKIEAVQQAYGRFMKNMRLRKRKSSASSFRSRNTTKTIRMNIHAKKSELPRDDAAFQRLLAVYDVAVQYSQHLSLEEVRWLVSFVQQGRGPADKETEKLDYIQKKLEVALGIRIRHTGKA